MSANVCVLYLDICLETFQSIKEYEEYYLENIV